jgi:hypothetical protein
LYRLKKLYRDEHRDGRWTAAHDYDDIPAVRDDYTAYLVKILTLMENEEEERRYNGEGTYDFPEELSVHGMRSFFRGFDEW